MLFLAVFLGFVAENIRENVVERHREKQFMSSLVKDLQLDTAEFSEGNKFRQKKIIALDSVINILSVQNTSVIPLSVYKSTRNFYGSRNFFQNSGTLDQLKNSGGLRLVHNRKVVDSISAYDQEVRRMIKRDEFENEYFVYNSRLSEKIFDTKTAVKFLVSKAKAIPDSSETIKINLAYLPEYLNNLMSYNFLIKNNQGVFERSKKKAANLLKLINKEYHLD
jgi:hypothetical protein